MKKTKTEILKGVEGIQFSKIVDNNTVKYKVQGSDKIYIRLHRTDIIIQDNKEIIISSGGWKTLTTKNRINKYQNICQIYQSKGVWYVTTSKGESVFYDGIKILNTGRITKPKKADKKTDKLQKLISAYCKKLSTLPVLPYPNSGDCWLCSLYTEADESLGNATKNTDHLISHLKEKYIHGSLIFNALTLASFPNPSLIFQMDLRDSIVNAVRNYFKQHLHIAR